MSVNYADILLAPAVAKLQEIRERALLKGYCPDCYCKLDERENGCPECRKSYPNSWEVVLK